MVKIIKYLVVSDIHLGHNTNKTPEIIDNLNMYFEENSKLFKTLDVIFIAGDITDKLLSTHSKDYQLVIEWLTGLIIFCSRNKIKLRILEGTPSHDWKQAKIIQTLISKFNIDVNFKYIDTLHIEIMSDINLSILYVPDEYKQNATDTYNEVLELMSSNKISTVDIAIMHGQFNYQLPMIKLKSSHDEELYLNIVKYYISIGHIHSFSVFDRILAQGSFDRIAHNEEEDKGGIVVTLNKSKPEFMFIKNKHSKIYKTITFKTNDVQELITSLSKQINKYPLGSNIRLIVNEELFISKSIKSIQDTFLGYTIKIDKPKNKDVTQVELLDNTIIEESFHITKDNIRELLDKEMVKHDLNQNQINVYKSELETILTSI